MYKRLFLVLLALLISAVCYGKEIYYSDVLGRDLAIPGLGWAGHVGLALGDDTDNAAKWVIEVLNEKNVIQMNSIDEFKKKTKYWGSRYGLGPYDKSTMDVLTEAYNQTAWCQTYTNSTDYEIGEGDLSTGKSTKCGKWRCDTFVAWCYYRAGYHQLMENPLILPRIVFDLFPLENSDRPTFKKSFGSVYQLKADKNFTSMSLLDINAMSYEEFEMVADIPLNQQTPQYIQAEWKLAQDTHLSNIKRGIFIDKISMSHEPNVIPKFIKMYQETNIAEIKEKLLEGVMSYYQNNLDQVKLNDENVLLKSFYAKLLNEKLNGMQASVVVRGYIDFHSPDEVLNNIVKIDRQLINIEPAAALGLKLDIATLSIVLEKKYISSVIYMLREKNSSQLEGIFFIRMKMLYSHLKAEQSINQIREYIESLSSKYLSLTENNRLDPYYIFAKRDYLTLFAMCQENR
ncbi:MAG: hypothetical protein P4M14_01920 [Gammaproteobacteria bacterium]|nr:hypothetical protein [Gammaproteobacteria bacterium]